MISENIKERIIHKTYNFISHQARTQKEIENRILRYLSKFDYTAEEKNQFVEDLIQNLLDQHFIDDEKYARDFVSSVSLSSKHRGKEYIKRFLFKKGISSNVIEASLMNTDEESEFESAKELCEKKLSQLKYKNTAELKNKLWRLLTYRGFSPNVIGRVIDSVVVVD